jgi:hypothetical protein
MIDYHPDHPGGYLADCWGKDDDFCIWTWGGVGKHPVVIDPSCGVCWPATNAPDDPGSWGTIKAMYK